MYGAMRISVRLLALFLLLFGAAASAQPAVTGVRIGDHAQTTRFVIDVTGEIDFQVFTLPDPYRVVVDTPELEWKASHAPEGEARGLIERYRFGLFEPGQSRIVLDVSGPVKIERAFVLAPQGPYSHRLVIDLSPTDRKSFLAVRHKKPRSKKSAALPSGSPKVRANGRKIIVIDPGHGGVDPGTISKNGRYEKRVTLSAGKAVKEFLERTGKYKVVMTRDRDMFIPLEKRVAIARQAGADLFLSLHADSIANRKIRGATVYTLSENASDKEAATLAKKENKADIIAGVDLDGESVLLTEILIDLMQRETMNYSAEFANILIPEMGRAVVMRTNSHRFAGFRVLKAPDVPSVLVEMGYLSNAKDVETLTSPGGVRKIARAIARAVDAYFVRRDARAASS